MDELLSGLDDLGLEVEHARRLEERKREDLQEYVRQHFAAIVEALRPQAEQVATETNEAARVFAAQLDRYREHGSRIHGLCAIAQHYGDAPLARDIEGYDAAGEFQKVVRSIDLPARPCRRGHERPRTDSGGAQRVPDLAARRRDRGPRTRGQ